MKQHVTRQLESEGMTAAAEPGCPEIIAIEIGQRPPEQAASGKDVETAWAELLKEEEKKAA